MLNRFTWCDKTGWVKIDSVPHDDKLVALKDLTEEVIVMECPWAIQSDTYMVADPSERVTDEEL